MHKALYPRDDVERVYVSRKEKGRELDSIEDSVNVPIRLEDNIKSPDEHRLLQPETIQTTQQNKNNQKMKMGRKPTV